MPTGHGANFAPSFFPPSAAGLRGRLSRRRKAGKEAAPFITRRQLGAPWGPIWAVPPLKWGTVPLSIAPGPRIGPTGEVLHLFGAGFTL